MGFRERRVGLWVEVAISARGQKWLYWRCGQSIKRSSKRRTRNRVEETAKATSGRCRARSLDRTLYAIPPTRSLHCAFPPSREPQAPCPLHNVRNDQAKAREGVSWRFFEVMKRLPRLTVQLALHTVQHLKRVRIGIQTLQVLQCGRE